MINISQIEKSYPFLKKIAEAATELHTEIYIVGGFVRDIILEREKKEIDFLVIGDGISFTEQLSGIIGGDKVSVFKNFGTAHFRYNDYDLEFVGARKESYDRTSRKPVVTNGSFFDDISRRDFTINTLALSLNKKNYGELIDTFGGLADLEQKLLRTPLNPEETFSDDPLRIMRAFRFASQLNFNVAGEIKTAARSMAERLQIVSQERITDEFLKILSSPKPSIGLRLLQENGVMRFIFPEVANLQGVDQRQDFHHKDVFYHTCKVVDNIAPNTNNVWLRFAALVHDIAKPQTKRFVENIGWTFHGHEDLGVRIMKGIFTRLKLPFHQLEYIRKLVRLHLRPIALAKEEVTDSAVRRFIVEAGEDLHDLITLCRADITSKNMEKVSEYLANYERVMNRVLEVEEKDKLRAFQSPVRGEEIMQICNLKPSKKVGEIKTAIEDAILDGIIPNTYEDALGYLYKIKEKYL
ncbi:MAG: CCA tRNA nucleotidyltransferase [Ignavibacteriaceae bacterium]|nr:CCA tRNA nucleotidyltransferase [Ignavibacteriaceae bacterium]